jgi:uncharacterized protein (PEP-CTERM system associated)
MRPPEPAFAAHGSVRAPADSGSPLNRWAPTVLGVIVVLVATSAVGQSWRYESSIRVFGLGTNNVDLSPTDQRRSDFITQITPSLALRERGSRTRLDGIVTVPILLYARSGGDNNTVYPSVDLSGDVEVIEDFFHVEGAVNVAQQFFSPFGPQPEGLTNATNNRYRTESYRLTPFVRSRTPGGTSYELRNNNVWVNTPNAPVNVANTRYTEWRGRAENLQTALGWRFDYDYTDVDFGNNSPQTTTQLARFSPVYLVDPQLRVSASGGYEDNQFAFTSSTGVIYGVGFEWRPTARAAVIGNWEHRFFGSAYLFSFRNRTPLTTWSIDAARNITTYPQQVAALRPGTNVLSAVNDIFLSSIPDPVARQAAVEQFIRDRGLPTVMTGALSIYSDQILLQESLRASVGLVGARNTILFAIFRLKSEPITGTGIPLPAGLNSFNNNTQIGGSVVWTSNLTPSVLLTASVDAYRTNANAPQTGTTDQGFARVALSTPLSARTTVFAGGRYQVLHSDVATDYNEAAIFVGLSYSFR